MSIARQTDEHLVSFHLVRKTQKDFPCLLQAHTFPAVLDDACPHRGHTGGWPSFDAPLLLRHLIISGLSWMWQHLEGTSAVIPISDNNWSVPGSPPGPYRPLTQFRTISLPLGIRNGVNPTYHIFGYVLLQPAELQVHVTVRMSSTLRDLFLFLSLVYNYYQLQ